MKLHLKHVLTAVAVTMALFSTASQARDIKIPNTLPLENPMNVGLKAFADEVAQKTNGALTFTIIPNGVLGNDQALIQQCLGGMLEAIAIGGLNAFQQQVPELGIDNLPFMFATPEESWKAYDGEFGEFLNAKVEKLGLKKGTFLVQGFRQITNNKHEVKTPEDLKGIKMRVPPVEIRMKAFKALGANPTPMPLPELFTALQQGAVDAQENPLVTILNMKFNEVQKYITLSNHIYDTAILYFNQKFWDTLPEDQQKIILEAGVTGKIAAREASKDLDAKCIETLKASGNVVTELTAEQHQLFVDAVKPVWDEYSATYGKEALELLEKSKH